MVRSSARLAAKPRRNYAKMANPASRGGKAAPRSKKAVTKLVKRVINSKAETKMACFFDGPVAGAAPLANSTGTLTSAAPVSHNPEIINNPTDILKVIPDVEQGNGDNQRNGKVINPVSGRVRCKVMLSPTTAGSQGWASPQISAYDLTFVAYLLQSVTFKTYRQLYVNNDFTKLLSVGDGTTINFDGRFSTANLPVEKGYYRVLAVKRKNLRSSGIFTAPGGVVTQVSNNNPHPLQHEWIWDYGKHMPKKLTYPEDTVTVANGGAEPLNSSIFWAVGYYNTDGTPPNLSGTLIQIEYTSVMKFKDF